MGVALGCGVAVGAGVSVAVGIGVDVAVGVSLGTCVAEGGGVVVGVLVCVGVLVGVSDARVGCGRSPQAVSRKSKPMPNRMKIRFIVPSSFNTIVNKGKKFDPDL